MYSYEIRLCSSVALLISTFEQKLDLTLDSLKNERCQQLFSDKVSGVRAEKTNFNKLQDYARAGDTIVVWKLDRLGRSTIQLIELVERLKKRGMHLKSLQLPGRPDYSHGQYVLSVDVYLSMNVIASERVPKLA